MDEVVFFIVAVSVQVVLICIICGAFWASKVMFEEGMEKKDGAKHGPIWI